MSAVVRHCWHRVDARANAWGCCREHRCTGSKHGPCAALYYPGQGVEVEERGSVSMAALNRMRASFHAITGRAALFVE